MKLLYVIAILALSPMMSMTAAQKAAGAATGEDGYRLWLRSEADSRTIVFVKTHTPTIDAAVEELEGSGIGAPVRLQLSENKNLKKEGFAIRRDSGCFTVSSATDIGLLYGSYNLIRLSKTGNLNKITYIEESPRYPVRVLNHWDNPGGSIERGYAGRSIWLWDELPGKVSPRYKDYARANASVGINGTVLNNVNATAEILSSEYIEKVKVLAGVFRTYGIRVYLSVNFSSPMKLGGLATADPLDKRVRKWWKDKAKEIYKQIPDFGGFLVKANSEGTAGPLDYGRTHADGANMLAAAVKPYGGIIMWRAFVYNPEDDDRAKQAYTEFKPLDGKFADNVIVQIKNGPIDFQPREPYSPLFGAMAQTKTMVEFQITQEYLGHANHLAYLAPMWKEFFEFVNPSDISAVAGVANIGSDRNWCGHDLAQSNWYAFGRLAWNPGLTSEEIAEEWLKQTFTSAPEFINPVKEMMLDSREAVVNYMMPMGLHHIFAENHHYGPMPWHNRIGLRKDWTAVYYHQADKEGIGFNRSSTGSGAVSQYPEPLCNKYDNIDTCPEKYLLWFHHVAWNYKMHNGRTLWENLCYKYDEGVKSVRDFQKKWDVIEGFIDEERFRRVQSKLKIQAKDAVWWKDACLLYFQEISGMPIPYDIERPIHSLEKLKDFDLGIDIYTCAPHGYDD